MKRFFAGLTKKRGRPIHLSDDKRFGTGLWRHNRDRFIRAVDRYYTTAIALHQSRAAEATAASVAGSDPIDLIVEGTHRLNELVSVVDEITARLHAHHPVTGQIIPALIRRAVGDTPELLSKASAKVAEAVLTASMARAEAAGQPIDSNARATERFITDAAELLERAQTNPGRLDQS